jgi:hypothetical protein
MQNTAITCLLQYLCIEEHQRDNRTLLGCLFFMSQFLETGSQVPESRELSVVFVLNRANSCPCA